MVVPHRAPARAALRRLVVLALLCTGLGLAWTLTNASSADEAERVPVPVATCGPGSRPETSIQGRVAKADISSGRAMQGYTCNTVEVARQGTNGGFKTIRYTDDAGHVCA